MTENKTTGKCPFCGEPFSIRQDYTRGPYYFCCMLGSCPVDLSSTGEWETKGEAIAASHERYVE